MKGVRCPSLGLQKAVQKWYGTITSAMLNLKPLCLLSPQVTDGMATMRSDQAGIESYISTLPGKHSSLLHT